MIIPTYAGQICVSDESSIRSDNLPLQKLRDDHLFEVPFVKEFTTAGACDSFMNSYAMLLLYRNCSWCSIGDNICIQLHWTPPDIVPVRDLNPLLHRFHQRTPYILIAKAVVDRWEYNMAHWPNE